MSNEGKKGVWLPAIFRKTTLGICIVVISLLLLAIISLRSVIEGDSDHFVERTVQRIEKVQHNSNGTTPSNLALEIRQDFSRSIEELHNRAIFYELLIHLAIAGIVALVLIYFIEMQVRKFNQRELSEFRKEITDNVWQAICSRLVPNEVTEQIESILQSDLIKKNVHYVITLDDLPGRLVDNSGEEGKRILLKRELVFTVENISGRDIVYPFRSQILTTGGGCMEIHIESNAHGFASNDILAFPRHELLSINGEVKNLDDPTENSAEYPISLEKNESCEVNHIYYEFLDVNDEVTYIQTISVIGLEVTIVNLIPHRVSIDEDIYFSHPEWKHLVQLPTQGNSKKWAFKDRAILPGQMFSVQWKRV